MEGTFSSPLKKAPLRFGAWPESSKRNGIATLFTVTVASHKPAGGWAMAAETINKLPAVKAKRVFIRELLADRNVPVGLRTDR